MNGTVAALSISTEKGVPKSNVDSIRVVEAWGIDGDAHAGNWHRQISLLMLESVNRMKEMGAEVIPGSFAENITTSGIDLTKLDIGNRIQIGNIELEITQIGKECHSRCAIYYAVGDCVMPREGIFAKVICGGDIRVGDTITTAS